jgi:hypothetical protein
MRGIYLVNLVYSDLSEWTLAPATVHRAPPNHLFTQAWTAGHACHSPSLWWKHAQTTPLAQLQHAALTHTASSHLPQDSSRCVVVQPPCSLLLAGMANMRQRADGDPVPRAPRADVQTHRHGSISRSLALGRGLETVNSRVGLETGHSGKSVQLCLAGTGVVTVTWTTGRSRAFGVTCSQAFLGRFGTHDSNSCQKITSKQTEVRCSLKQPNPHFPTTTSAQKYLLTSLTAETAITNRLC